MRTTIATKSIQDWLSTPEGEHWELIHGELFMTAESYANSSLAGEIAVEMALYLRAHPLGAVERNIAFILPGIPGGEKEGVIPDLCFLRNEELAKVDPRANAQEGFAPALVAETLSPSTRERDLVEKVEIYREAGVAEYWIFDLEAGTVRIYRFGEDRERPVALLTFDNTLTTPLLPDLELRLSEIQRRINPRRPG